MTRRNVLKMLTAAALAACAPVVALAKTVPPIAVPEKINDNAWTNTRDNHMKWETIQYTRRTSDGFDYLCLAMRVTYPDGGRVIIYHDENRKIRVIKEA